MSRPAVCPPPVVSVIIVAHNSQRTIERTLGSVWPAAGALPVEVIVVDAASEDATGAVLEQSGFPICYFRTANQGFAAAANVGAGLASGHLLFFLNPDAVLPVGGLCRLADVLADERAAAVTGVLSNSAGKEETTNEPFPSLAWYLRRRFPWRPAGVSEFPSVTARPFSVPFLSGAALLIRAEAFRAVGGFHPEYFLYYEDIDLCRRLRARGYTLLLDPKVRIVHAGGQSAPRSLRRRWSDLSEDVYFARYRPAWERRVLRILRSLVRLPVLARAGGALLAGGVAGSFLGAADGWSAVLAGAVFSAAAVLAVRAPAGGAVLLLFSLLPGQLLRIPFFGSVSLTVTDVLLPFVVWGWWLAAWKERRARRAPPKLSGRAVCLFSWFVAALVPGLLLVFERLPRLDGVVAAGYAVRALLILALIPLGARVLRRSWLVPGGLLVVASLLALLGALQVLLFPSFTPVQFASALCASLSLEPCGSARWDPHVGRAFATWLDPNLLGGLFVLALGALLAAPRVLPLSGRFLLLVSGGLLIVGLVFTQSRTSLVALLAVLALSVFLMRSWRRAVPLLGFGVLSLALVPSFLARVQSLSAMDPTAALRFHSWQQALETFNRAPVFGIGYNAYMFEQLSRGAIADFSLHSKSGAESSMLTLLATTGGWGGVLALILATVSVWILLRCLRGTEASAWLARAALLALAGLLVHAQFVHSLAYVHLAVPLALLVSTVSVPRSTVTVRP